MILAWFYRVPIGETSRTRFDVISHLVNAAHVVTMDQLILRPAPGVFARYRRSLTLS
ncbi:hypothetical protein CUJ84_Chr000104 [Rhizobium leguminosarum]|uniref:Uncharacterized protein n=1 Tax=Rhizobium leguminosarum TaxID=384 RepID=A0A2K9YX39_RHILE|nr:hypothetical protein CUJ84_Chr000104 [Rhizobium leguminosarum]